MAKGDKKLTVLFAHLNSLGHLNGSLGLAQELQSRGHRVVWAFDRSFKDVLIPFGFEVEVVGPEEEDKEFWPTFLSNIAQYIGDSLVIAEKFVLPGFKFMLSNNKEWEQQYKVIIEKVKPDVIIVDQYVCAPILISSGIPWVFMSSAAPAMILNDKRVAPKCSGLPNDGDPKEWQRFTDNWNELFNDFQQEISLYSESIGGPKIIDKRLHPLSPHLNIYVWPKVLRHEVVQPLLDNMIGVENVVRVTNETFEIPAQLRQRPGKLVYFSLGSIGCGLVDLMKRLIGILAKSQHNFIVSKGSFLELNEWPENMFAEEFLPQIAVLPLVDLVITHGGNNTVTESFYAGKPVLVLPLFGDQFENAQRVEEKGLGIRLNPAKCSEDELLNAVDRLLADEGLAQRMTAIGESIRRSNDKKVVSDRIEMIV